MRIVTRGDQQFREHELLSPDAAFSDESDGRDRSSDPDFLRNDFQRDRDKILHTKSFRRLSHKTQVFLAAEGDHFRTRLTHTLEVSQIARTIARALGLNEDLAEAISLGHDLGHTPFGHTGEDALCRAIARVRGVDPESPEAAALYRHNEQSLRVVETIENGGRGLNLMPEVRDGILCHTGPVRAETLEGRIVAVADRIAYVNHDIDDAIRAGVLREEDIPRAITQMLGDSKTKRITALIRSVVENSREGAIAMDPATYQAYTELEAFMYQAVYLNEYAKKEERKVPHIIQSLFVHFRNPDHLPDYMQKIAEEEGVDTASCDYVAGMTDHYAVACYQELFIPKAWNLGLGH